MFFNRRVKNQKKQHLVNTSGATGVALDGYDPVSFFADAANPLNGNFEISSEYKGAKYFFATEDNKTTFESNPEKYAPQHGGFCSYGASVGALFPVDIKTAQVHNGKLFLNLNTDIVDMFNKDIDGAIAKADKNFPALAKKQGVVA